MVDKSDISNLVNNSDLNTKLAALSIKAELEAEQDTIVKLQTHNLSDVLGKIFLVMMVSRILLFINQHVIR